MPLHEVPDRFVLIRHHPASDAAKALNIEKHPEKRPSEQVGWLGEDTSKVGCVLTAMVQRIGEGHVARFCGHVEVGEQSGEVWIGDLVVDDETGIDPGHSGTGGHIDGVGVPTDSRVGLIDDYLIVLVQSPCRAEAGYPTSHDGDSLSHKRTSLLSP